MSTILIVAAGGVALIALWIWLSVKIGNKFGAGPQNAEPWKKRQRGGYRLFAQVSLGEIIGADDPLEYACVNSKRCDFVVIDAKGYPALAIEY